MAMTSSQDGPLIIKLDSPAATLELVGGKGASLARLAAASLPVPPGFHSTTHAYRRFIDENHLGPLIVSAAAPAHPDDPTTLDRASTQIQSLMGLGVIPSDIAALIRKAYDQLDVNQAP